MRFARTIQMHAMLWTDDVVRWVALNVPRSIARCFIRVALAVGIDGPTITRAVAKWEHDR